MAFGRLQWINRSLSVVCRPSGGLRTKAVIAAMPRHLLYPGKGSSASNKYLLPPNVGVTCPLWRTIISLFTSTY